MTPAAVAAVVWSPLPPAGPSPPGVVVDTTTEVAATAVLAAVDGVSSLLPAGVPAPGATPTGEVASGMGLTAGVGPVIRGPHAASKTIPTTTANTHCHRGGRVGLMSALSRSGGWKTECECSSQRSMIADCTRLEPGRQTPLSPDLREAHLSASRGRTLPSAPPHAFVHVVEAFLPDQSEATGLDQGVVQLPQLADGSEHQVVWVCP